MRRIADPVGFTLVELLVASTLLMVAWLATARILTASGSANGGARALTLATTLAVEKMEQLRALSIDDPALAPSPVDTLAIDVNGYHDTPDARYARHWSVEPLASYPAVGIVIRVTAARSFGGGEARLETIKTRKAE